MDALRDLVLSLCIAGVVSAVYRMLAPSGTFDRQLRLLIALFFLLAIVTPFLGGRMRLDTLAVAGTGRESSSMQLENAVNAQLASQAAGNLERTLRQTLEEAGGSVAEIRADVHIGEGYSISISEIQLVLRRDSALSAEQAETLAAKEVGGEAVVTAAYAEVESGGQ